MPFTRTEFSGRLGLEPRMPAFNDLRLLTVFAAVYRQEGISAAARVLNVSQPAVSRSIRKLEDELGSPLFDRSATGIRPTEFGSRLYRRAIAIISEVDNIQADAADTRPGERVLLNVGVGLGCWVAVCDAMAEYRSADPSVVFNTTIASARRLLAESERDGTDLIVANELVLESAGHLHVEFWKQSSLYLVAREDHDVFSSAPEEQLTRVETYPLATHQMLEYAHGSPWAGIAALRASDHLYLLRYTASTDAYLPVDGEMLSYAEKFGLATVGDRPVDITRYSIAWREDVESRGVEEFARFLLERPSS